MRRIATLIARWEWLLMLLIVPPLLFPGGWRGLFLLVIPLLWINRRIATGHFFPRTPFDVALLALLITVLTSLYAVFDIVLSFPKIAGVVLGIALLYTAVAFVRDRPHGIWYLLGFTAAAGVGLAAVGLLGARWTGPFAPLNRLGSLLPVSLSSIPGTVGGFVNANQLAGTMDWVAPLLIAAAIGLARPMWRSGRGPQRLLWLLLAGTAVFTTAVLIATLSRGGILGLAAALLVMLAIRYRWGRVLLITALVAAVALVFYLDLNTLFTAGNEAVDEFGLQGRVEIWSRALYGLEDFPITGMSMNGFRRVVHILYPLFLVSPDADLGHAHNHLLQAGLDLGLPGLVAYLSLWLLSAGLLWWSWKHATRHSNRVLIIGLSGALTAGWIFGILDAIALGARTGFVWWLLLSLLVAVVDRVRIDVDAGIGTAVGSTQTRKTTPSPLATEP